LLNFATVRDIAFVIHGNTGRFDGDTTFLLVLTSVSVSGISSNVLGDDSCLADQGVRESTLSVIDVGNDRHVSDVVLVVHDLSDLLNGEVDHSFSSTIDFNYINKN
jgi:hypothetical protein